MGMYHKFYIKQMNLVLDVVQPIYVQNLTIFGYVWRLAIEDAHLFGHLPFYLHNFDTEFVYYVFK